MGGADTQPEGNPRNAIFYLQLSKGHNPKPDFQNSILPNQVAITSIHVFLGGIELGSDGNRVLVAGDDGHVSLHRHNLKPLTF